MVGRFSLFKETQLLRHRTQTQNGTQRFRMQSSATMSSMKKRATTQTSLDCFLKRVDRIESSKEPEPVPSLSGMSGIAACPPSPIADDPVDPAANPCVPALVLCSVCSVVSNSLGPHGL